MSDIKIVQRHSVICSLCGNRSKTVSRVDVGTDHQSFLASFDICYDCINVLMISCKFKIFKKASIILKDRRPIAQ